MYGAPLSSWPTSMTRHDVLALELRARARLAHQPLHDLGLPHDVLVQELERDRLIELQVRRDDDDTHSTLAERALDAKLPCDDRPWLHGP